MKHVKILLKGVVAMIFVVILLGIALLPQFIAIKTNNNNWYWLFSVHVLLFSYLLGWVYSLEEGEDNEKTVYKTLKGE